MFVCVRAEIFECVYELCDYLPLDGSIRCLKVREGKELMSERRNEKSHSESRVQVSEMVKRKQERRIHQKSVVKDANTENREFKCV